MRKDDLYGILNGIDYDTNNPETDPNIPYHSTLIVFILKGEG